MQKNEVNTQCELCENPATIADWGAELCADCWERIDAEVLEELGL